MVEKRLVVLRVLSRITPSSAHTVLVWTVLAWTGRRVRPRRRYAAAILHLASIRLAPCLRSRLRTVPG